MISVDLDKILTEEDVFNKIRDLVAGVEANKEMFVITKDGKPQAALVNIDYLEELTGSPIKEEHVASSEVEENTEGSSQENESELKIDNADLATESTALIEEEEEPQTTGLTPPPVGPEPTPTPQPATSTPEPAASTPDSNSINPQPASAPIFPSPTSQAPTDRPQDSQTPPFIQADQQTTNPPQDPANSSPIL